MKDLMYSFVCKLDHNSSKLCNKIKNYLKPITQEKIPISDSWCNCTCASYSGTDIKCYILDPEQELYKEDKDGTKHKNGAIGSLLGISFGHITEEKLGGNMVGVVLENMKDFHKLLGQKKRIIVEAANEYGDYAVLYDGIVKFADGLDWGMGIDDIVCEVTLLFEQISQKLDI